jgi:hypothetical protein
MTINAIIVMLRGGTLASDGCANKAADIVIQDNSQMALLIAALQDRDDVVRARAAHAVERVSRKLPRLVLPHYSLLVKLARHDPVPMVKWHIVMIMGNLSAISRLVDSSTKILLSLLNSKGEGVFVKSWAIVSLTILAKKYPLKRKLILRELTNFEGDNSAAIRSKVTKAIAVLADETIDLPKGWSKIG